ncbi:MAG: T9SS type A sorting domain-containing protein [Candidatus Kapaibacteriales bacterium]
MKNLTFAFLIPILSLGLLLAKPTQMLIPVDGPNLKPMDSKIYPNQILDYRKVNADELQATYRTITSVINGNFTLFNFINPFTYDPYSQALILSLTNYTADNSGNLVGTINLFYSLNNGATWSSKNIFNRTGEIPVFPSIGVWNPSSSPNFSNLSFFVYTPFARRDISGNYPWAGGLFTISQPSGNESVDFLYPGNNAGYMWWTTRVKTHTTNDGSFAYAVGMLRQSSEGSAQYGQYGYAIFSLNDYDFLNQGTPNQWALSKFRTSTEVNSTYNSNILIDVDNQGAAYAAVLNYFKPNDEDANARVPGVSKSTDYGQTWDEFQPMPVSVFVDYAQSYGGIAPSNLPLISGPYYSNAFVAIGPDQFSFFTRFLVWEDENHIAGAHIVECFYQNGLWTVRKVSDFLGFSQYIADVAIGQEQLKDSLMVSFLGQELQAALTADRQFIVVKWVDYIDKLIAINPPLGLNPEQTIDTLLTNDVFLSYRPVNGYNWSEPFNATNDTLYNKCTFIPNPVPSLSNVPIIQLNTRQIQYTDPNNPRNRYPRFIQQLVVDYPQDVVFTTANLISAVEKEETLSMPFQLLEATPNPVSNFVDLKFKLDQSMNVRLELIDLFGNKVATLYEGPASEGLNAIVLNTNKYPDGTYFYRLEGKGRVETKRLVIVR